MDEIKALSLPDFDISLERGFLPDEDPLTEISHGLDFLDEFGNKLPEIIISRNLLSFAKLLPIPPDDYFLKFDVRHLRLLWVRYSFIQSAYVHSQKSKPFTVCESIARPIVALSKILKIKPILSYSAYVLYNWKRKDPKGPIEVDNLELIQTFMRDPEQSWFNLIHVDIEAKAGLGIKSLWNAVWMARCGHSNALEFNLHRTNKSLESMITAMKRMPEGTFPDTYYKIRPWIWSFEDVVYEGVDEYAGLPQNFRGQTGAQTSIFQALEAGLQMPLLSDNELSRHLYDMRKYMPSKHRELVEYLENNSNVREYIISSEIHLIDIYDDIIMKELIFLAIHFGYAIFYIAKKTTDPNPRGTGDTPFMKYLRKRIEERWRRAFIKSRTDADLTLFLSDMEKTVEGLLMPTA